MGTETRSAATKADNGSNGWVWANNQGPSPSPTLLTSIDFQTLGPRVSLVRFAPTTGGNASKPVILPTPYSSLEYEVTHSDGSSSGPPMPLVSPGGGTFAAANFPASATIGANGVPGECYSTLQYQVTHSYGASTGRLSYTGAVALTSGDTLNAQNVSNNTTLYTDSSTASLSYIIGAIVLPTPVMPTGGSFQTANFPNSISITSNGAPVGFSLLEYNFTHANGSSGA